MSRGIDETGNIYGELTVIRKADKKIKEHLAWECQCSCGSIIIVVGTDLRKGKKTDCGCKTFRYTAEIGNTYGKLTVIDKVGLSADRHMLWKCQCSCGNITIVRGSDLRSNKVFSCGCYNNEVRGQSTIIDETGHIYGNLKVLKLSNRENKGKSKGAYWDCQCTCGNIISAYGASLRNGTITSCGCIKSKGEQFIQAYLNKHQISYKKEYTFQDLISSKGGYPRFDFAIFNQENQLLFLIEYQGSQHYIDKKYFGQMQREETDLLKQNYCKNKNIILYTISYEEDLELSLNKIFNFNN